MANTKKKSGSSTRKKSSSAKSGAKKKTSSRKSSGTTKKSTASGRNSGGKKTTKSTVNSGNNNSKTRNPVKENHGIPMGNEVKVILSFGIMLLMMLSNFGICGSFGRIINQISFGIFGCVQYVMPVAFFLAVVILVVNEYSVLSLEKVAAGFITLMMISAFVQLIYQGDSVTITDLFSVSGQDHMTGGIIGGGVALLLKGAFGIIGSMIIIFCVMLLSLVVLTQRSFVDFFSGIVSGICSVFRRRKSERSERFREDDDGQLEMELNEEEDTLKRKRRSSKKTSWSNPFRAKSADSTAEETETQKKDYVEEKLKELEEERKERILKEKSPEYQAQKAKIRANVPKFTSSDDIKKKDETQELHPSTFPFTFTEGDSEPFDGQLDFTAFSFNSGKTPEEYNAELQERFRAFEEQRKNKDTFEPPYKSKGSFTSDELKPEEPQENATFEDEMIIALPETRTNRRSSVNPEKKILKTNTRRVSPREPVVVEPVEEVPVEVIDNKNEPDISVKEVKPERKKKISEPVNTAGYQFPPVTLLEGANQTVNATVSAQQQETASKLQATLNSFGINVTMTGISCGPAVTRYEMVPEAGTKVSKIVSLTDDIKLSLAAADIRIEAPIPGKSAIGIEVPNKKSQTVHFGELLGSQAFKRQKSKIAFAVGKDIGGNIIVSDIAKMPHLLIAGATGSGKSVCINTLIMSILFKATPDEVKLIMVDPKKVELNDYNGIPHLLIPVVTDPKKASGALNWACHEMMERYDKFTECSVRNIEGYNAKVESLIASGEVDPEEMAMKKMPQIVIIIDELADLMMVAQSDVEDAIVRLSQLARAAGIHLVIATQRPSVNVITGLIKANVPSRIAFAVSSGIDSRTILDMNGAEKLLGKGDMLFFPQGMQKPVRVQGAFIDDEEVTKVVDFIKNNNQTESQTAQNETVKQVEQSIKMNESSKDRDEYFEAAARFVVEKDKATIGMLQRMFKIGFNRAARIMDQLSEAEIVGPEEGTKPRKVLMSEEQLQAYFEEYV